MIELRHMRRLRRFLRIIGPTRARMYEGDAEILSHVSHVSQTWAGEILEENP